MKNVTTGHMLPPCEPAPNISESLWTSATLKPGESREIALREFTGWATYDFRGFTARSFFCAGDVRDMFIEFRIKSQLLMERAPAILFTAACPHHAAYINVDILKIEGPSVLFVNDGKKPGTIYMRLIGEGFKHSYPSFPNSPTHRRR